MPGRYGSSENARLPVGLNGHRPHRQTSIHVQEWRDQARCAGTDPNTFHPPEGGDGRPIAAAARALCHNCPVRIDCLATAIAESEQMGIWGGCTERERRTIRRAIGVVHAGPDEIPIVRARLVELLEGDHTHGTAVRHAYGCRCDACRFAGGATKTDRKYQTQEAS